MSIRQCCEISRAALVSCAGINNERWCYPFRQPIGGTPSPGGTVRRIFLDSKFQELNGGADVTDGERRLWGDCGPSVIVWKSAAVGGERSFVKLTITSVRAEMGLVSRPRVPCGPGG